MTSDAMPQERPLETAVLFMVFNRPETTLRVFDAIRRARPTRLYVAADGPRQDRAGEVARVESVRKIATAVDWPCEVKTLFRDQNLGCGPAVKDAIDWFFEFEDEGIILEDDTVPSLSFFYFCEILLNDYKNDLRVAMIAGTNHIGYCTKGCSFCFSKNKACWGWATWRRAWKNMDINMQWSNTMQKHDVIKNMGCSLVSQKFWVNAITLIEKNKVSAWDWQWYFSISMNNQLTIFPKKNLVSNIGFGKEATHTLGVPKKSYLQVEETDFPLVHPMYVVPDFLFDHKFESSKLKRPALLIMFIQKLRKVFQK